MRSPKKLYWAAVVVIGFTAIVVASAIRSPTILSAQTAVPYVFQETDVPDEVTEINTATISESLSTEKSDTTDVDTEVKIQRRFNELRRELLDDRADTVNWWLTAAATFVTLFGVGAAIGGYIGFNRFREIEAEARENVRKAEQQFSEAQRLVEGIRENWKQSGELVQRIRDANIEDTKDPVKAREISEAAKEVQKNPNASVIEREIAAAYSLQRNGKIEEAIEKWRYVANIAKGIDDDIVARAWFAIAYLLQEAVDG